MEALLEDGAALGIGMAVSAATAMALLIIAVALINWSALRQVLNFPFYYNISLSIII